MKDESKNAFIFGSFRVMILTMLARLKLRQSRLSVEMISVALAFGLFSTLPISQVLGADKAAPKASAESQWEKEIHAFEVSDATNPPPKGATLFIGSSSIRLWKTLREDFPGQNVINRGFGGSQIKDSTAFADRIVIPYHPKRIVLYAGDNDINAGESAENVFEDFKAFVSKVRSGLPGVPIVYIAIKPSVARWKLADKIRTANRLIQDYCQAGSKLTYVDVFTPMLDSEGQPRKELLVKDGLHMNREGYQIWAEKIRPILQASE